MNVAACPPESNSSGVECRRNLAGAYLLSPGFMAPRIGFEERHHKALSQPFRPIGHASDAPRSVESARPQRSSRQGMSERNHSASKPAEKPNTPRQQPDGGRSMDRIGMGTN